MKTKIYLKENKALSIQFEIKSHGKTLSVIKFNLEELNNLKDSDDKQQLKEVYDTVSQIVNMYDNTVEYVYEEHEETEVQDGK